MYDSLAALRSLLLRGAHVANELTSPAQWNPLPGSPGETELHNTESGPAGPWGENPVRTAWANAAMAIRAAGAYARAVETLAAAEQPVLAAETIARGALEAGSAAFWLLEPRIGARARVCRLQLNRIGGALWLRRALAETKTPGPAEDFGDTPEGVRKISDDLGLEPFSDIGREEAAKCETERRPGYTARVARMLSEQTFAGGYVIYSGTSHAELWALRRHFFVTAAAGPGLLDLAPDPKGLRTVINGILISILVPLQEAGQLFGWHGDDGSGAVLSALIEDLNAEMVIANQPDPGDAS